MEIQFTQSRPQSARLVAQVTDKGKVPVGLDKAMTEGMEAARFKGCLLYTSDAADDSLRVDLGGRRIIKKAR